MSSVLLVCTGNICRSPMAQGCLGDLLRRRGVRGITVESAGVWGREGEPALPEAVAALEERGIDISGHVVRRLRRRSVVEADLVLGMAVEHRYAVLGLVPSARPRTFTLKELVDLLERHPLPRVEGDPARRLRQAVARAHEVRTGPGYAPPADPDVRDPLGGGPEAFRRVAAEIEDLSRRLVEGLFGPAREADPAARAELPSPAASGRRMVPTEGGAG